MQGREICNYLPTHLWIEPTNICNLKCIICPNKDSDRKKGYMPFDLFCKIMDQAVNKPMIYLFVVGEPLLHPDIFRMIRYVRQQGASAGLFTNATLLDKAKAENLLDSEPDWLGFSFNGYNRAAYEQIRENADFDRTLENIKGFLRLKQTRQRQRPYTCLSLIESPGSSSISAAQEKESFLSPLLLMGLNQFDESPLHNWAGNIQSFSSHKAIKKRPGRMTRCPAPWSSLGILWDGRVVPCCLDMNGEYVVGNIYEHTLEEIWNGLPLQRLRKIFAENKAHTIPLCKSCHILNDPTFLGIPMKVWTEAFDMARTALHSILIKP